LNKWVALHRSKLELYVDILGVLARDGPLKSAQLLHKANVNCSAPNEKLNFLMRQNLVEEKAIKQKHLGYAITKRGATVLGHLRELKAAKFTVRKPPSKHSNKDRFSNTRSQGRRRIIGNFIRTLRAAGGVVDSPAFLDLMKETKAEMNLDQIRDAELLSIRAQMEEMGYIRRTTDTGTELWVLTLEGLKFVERRHS